MSYDVCAVAPEVDVTTIDWLLNEEPMTPTQLERAEGYLRKLMSAVPGIKRDDTYSNDSAVHFAVSATLPSVFGHFGSFGGYLTIGWRSKPDEAAELLRALFGYLRLFEDEGCRAYDLQLDRLIDLGRDFDTVLASYSDFSAAAAELDEALRARGL